VLSSVAISGNEHVSRTLLMAAARRELRSYAENGLRPADAADAAWSMELLLRNEGYPDGVVEFAIDADVLRFTVIEGPRATLGKVTLHGVKRVPYDEAAALFALPGPGVFGEGDPLFRLADLEGAVLELQHLYLLRGFKQVRIHGPEVRWTEDRTRADVAYTVIEGPQYVVRAVDFEGIEPRDLGLVGEPYHARTRAQTAARVGAALRGDGHQFAFVKVEEEFQEGDAETVGVLLRVVGRPGPPVTLRHIELEGLEDTSEWFARRRVPLVEGELLRQDLLGKGIDELYRTRLFKSVRTRLEPVGEEPASLADLFFELDERQTTDLEFELGYGSYELVRGAVTYTEDNVLGLGRRGRARLYGSVRGIGVDLNLEDNYVLGEHHRLDLNASFFRRQEPSFERIGYSASAVVRLRQRGRYRLWGGYTYKKEEARDIIGAIPPAEEDGFITTAGLFITLRRDSRDNLQNPASGSLWELTLGYSAPALGADLHFFGLETRFAIHKRVTERTILALGGQFRSREILDNRETLPIQDRFFLGGGATVRSFDQDELGPINVLGQPTGGLTSMFVGVEARIRITRNVHAGVFYDVGLVDPRSWSFESELGQGVGVGVRYLLPVGPIRLDFAYNPGELFAATQRWQLHLNIGFSF